MIVLQAENAQCYITRSEAADYQGTIDDFDKVAEISGLGAHLHNLVAHAHMHAAFAQIEDDNIDTDNTAPPANSPKVRSDTSRRRWTWTLSTPKPTKAFSHGTTTSRVWDQSDKNEGATASPSAPVWPQPLICCRWAATTQQAKPARLSVSAASMPTTRNGVPPTAPVPATSERCSTAHWT